MKMSKFLVVHDPIREEQPALERAALVAEKLGTCLHLFGCINSDLFGADAQSESVAARLREHQQTLQACAEPYIARGISITTEAEWDKDWCRAAIRASKSNDVDMVYKSSYRHRTGHRLLRSTSDWTLIRECPMPVMLVKKVSRPDVPVILAAVDISARTEPYEKLNSNILELSRGLVATSTVDVHVVNAFPDFRVTPNPQKLIDVSGLDKSKIHIKLGPPDRVIVDEARRLDANLVVVGNSHRSGLAAMFQGNTAEKILDKLDCNVLAMP